MGSLNISLGSNDTTKERGFKWRDFDLRFIKGVKDYNTHDDLNAVKQGLFNIFTWNQGERILLPEFGNNIRQYLYEPINQQTITETSKSLREAIERWEPRVNIVNIRVEPDPDDVHALHISLVFTVPSISNEEYVFTEFITGELGAI